MLQWHRSSRVALLTKVNKLVSPSYLAVGHAYSMLFSLLLSSWIRRRFSFFLYFHLFPPLVHHIIHSQHDPQSHCDSFLICYVNQVHK